MTPRTDGRAESPGGHGEGAAQFEVVTGNPTATELAAVTAVIAQLVEELSVVEPATDLPAQGRWERGASLRQPLPRGGANWRGFIG